MASLGHIAVGLAAARVHRTAPPRWSSMAWWSALSMLPDADVVGFGLGVEYGDPWGHRGATHSVTFAFAVATALGVAAPKLGLPAVRTWLIAALTLVSHGLLDTLTDGGLGCALLWPFDLTRYFAPWQPIPVAPIGLDFISPYGLLVAATELVLFAPLVLFGLGLTRIQKYFLPVWALASWLIVSADPVREAAIGLVLREDTEYAAGFSERSFRSVGYGDRDTDVRHLLGPPLREWWHYPPTAPGQCLFVFFEPDVVSTAPQREPCSPRGIQPGMTRDDVRRALGPPAGVCWAYTRSPGDRRYRARAICFSNGRVVELFRLWD